MFLWSLLVFSSTSQTGFDTEVRDELFPGLIHSETVALGSLLDDCWSGWSRGAVWLQLLTYIQSEGSNAYYVNSSAIFSGKLCQLFCLGALAVGLSPSLTLSSVTTAMVTFIQQCQKVIKLQTNVHCQLDVRLSPHTVPIKSAPLSGFVLHQTNQSRFTVAFSCKQRRNKC